MRQKMIAVWCVAVFFFALTGNAQVTTGTISGTVQDSTGAVIPGVDVTVTNLDTGITRSASTDVEGRYQVLNIGSGNYEVQAQTGGFRTEIRRGIVMTVGRRAVVNFDLQVGAVTQTVEVTGEAPLVETRGSSVSSLVETAQIESLPLNGRSFDELTLMQPAITISKFGNRQIQNGFTVKISIRGARPEQNSWLLDGTNVMNSTNSVPGSVGGKSLGVDAVREFKVETTAFSAQYGKAAGGVINIITKSGTNQFHGTVFEFLRNDN
ncbi:MAG: carboxypeptidase regulatory-like domain-containing protein, partial [Acidobacteria bacterium]|nr:carboxypeptidase regulatory-like domain-containing protein [Acidobacteriota bacterium]